MKGIILAAGTGSRLHPSTKVVNKHFFPIYDKPAIFYSLSLFFMARIKEILIICRPEDEQMFYELFGTGDEFGVNFTYAIQEQPRGICDAFLLGEDFISNSSVLLVLGDNLFVGQGLSKQLENAVNDLHGAKIFTHTVADPSRFGIAELDESLRVISVEEKPEHPKSRNAITGLYMFDNSVVEKAKFVTPSERGELEITSLLNAYLIDGVLSAERLGRGAAWFDTGTPKSYVEASTFVQLLQTQQGLSIGHLHELAFGNGWIDTKAAMEIVNRMPKSSYAEYFSTLVNT